MLTSKLALSDTATLELEGPDGDPVGILDESEVDEDGKPVLRRMTLELLRGDSKEAERFKNKAKNERLRKASRTGRLDITQEQIAEEAVDIAVYCTRGWTNFEQDDGTPLPFTAENVRALYSDKRFSWLYDQVDAFISRSANFAGNS